MNIEIETYKYRPYAEWSEDDLDILREKVKRSQWRQSFHVQPETGWLNDPNGFAYFNGEWQLFYQAFPFGTINGLKSWYKVVSSDLVNWKAEGAAIIPDTSFDSHGVYSGSALPFNDELHIFYTGNVRDDTWKRKSYQLGAVEGKDGVIKKLNVPLIDQAPIGYTTHFRDPQILKINEQFYLLLGAQTDDLKGRILIYSSYDMQKWEYQSELHFSDQDLGYMIECPHLVKPSNTPLLLFCPQGLSQDILQYGNANPNCYSIAKQLDLETGIFTPAGAIQNLDDGFDVYATQAIDGPDGRTLAVSWLGLAEKEYPVVKDGWTNCLSLVKELTIVNDQLYQYPVQEIKDYRKLISQKNGLISGSQVLHRPVSNNYEYEIIIKNKSKGRLLLMADENLQHYFEIRFDTEKGWAIANRSKAGQPIIETNSSRKTRLTPGQDIKMDIFVDTSSIEIFFNDGIKVSSALVFPHINEVNICLEGLGINYNDYLYSIEV